MKLKHTQKKSANRSMRRAIFKDALIGITRKHGQRLEPDKQPRHPRPKPRRRRVDRTDYPTY